MYLVDVDMIISKIQVTDARQRDGARRRYSNRGGKRLKIKGLGIGHGDGDAISKFEFHNKDRSISSWESVKSE